LGHLISQLSRNNPRLGGSHGRLAPIKNLRTDAREASEEDEIHAFKHTHALTPHCRTPGIAKFQQVESIQNRWNRSIKTENLATKIQKKAKVTAFLGRIVKSVIF
jgi:hypothetical protein